MNKVKTVFKRIWQYDFAHIFVYSLLLTLVIECLNKRSIAGLLMIFTSPVIFFYNLLIIMVCMSISFLFKRKTFVYALVSLIWIILAVINFAVLCSRKTPFTAMDIYLIKDAIKVIPLYINVFQMILIAIGIIAAIAGLVWLFRKAPKKKIECTKRKFYIYGVMKIVFLGLILYSVTTTFIINGTLSTHFGNLAQAYNKYGFAYCFSSSVIERGISKSGEYSSQYMLEIKQSLEESEEEKEKSTPNIIFLQLESFFNPKLVKGTTYSENPTPNFDRLLSECTSGYLSVPCFGAGTANTEFEVQTGINLDDFGPGEYPYKTVLQSEICESTAYNLKALGYSTHAIHNNDATFYDRYKVFSHLGYDTFTSLEYMNGYETTPTGWAKDKILTGEIKKALDSTDGADYIYTISVQGHGDYPAVMPEGYTPSIKVSGFFDKENATAFEYYVNQISEMDKFIGELIDSLSQRDEETVLVMYGDHLPTFNFTNETQANGDIYETQYIMWSNFSMKKESVDLQAYQLSSYVLQRLGISEGYITKYHQTKKNDPDYLKNLKILEYDILYGKKNIYDGECPYKATKLHMGIDDIEITSAYNYRNYVCVEGNNFNEFSVVYINGKEYPTEIINNNLLRVTGVTLKNDSVVSVAQRGKDKIELSRVTWLKEYD